MKILQYSLIFFCFSCFARADFFGYHEYVSPNKKYVAQVNRSDREVELVIKNQLSKKEEFSTKQLIPAIEYVQWSPDSESLLIVAHISGGSHATLLHHNNRNGWANYDCNPPLNITYKGSIAGIKFLKNFLELTYIVCPTTPHGAIIDFRLYVFDVCYETGEMTLKTWNPITEKKFRKLHANAEELWEKWQKRTSKNS